MQYSINNTKIYKETEYPEIERNYSDEIVISVNKYRTFETVQYYKRKFPNLKIAALNFESATNVGGGVKKGSRAQEKLLDLMTIFQRDCQAINGLKLIY